MHAHREDILAAAPITSGSCLSMNLAIFDLDGTLTQTSGVDDDCWIRAVRMAWGVEGIATDWSAYRHSTDEGIAAEIMETHHGRPATRQDLDTLRDCFASLIDSEARSRPERFTATAGAENMLRALPERGWGIAIATGGWQRTALIKLRTAGLVVDGIAAAFADDAWPREQIIEIAASRARERAGCVGGPIHRIVYVGDGVWDVTAARVRGYGFIGVAKEPRAGLLRRAGAPTVFTDLTDVDRVVDAIERGSTLRPLAEAG